MKTERQRTAKRETSPGDTQRAFALADRERDELSRLRASGRPYACLEFVGAFGYGRTPSVLDSASDGAARVGNVAAQQHTTEGA